MTEFYFTTKSDRGTILCISTLTDRKAAAVGPDIETPLGYYLYEASDLPDDEQIEIIARLPSEDAALRLRELLGMK